jgi:hypothetical protein
MHNLQGLRTPSFSELACRQRERRSCHLERRIRRRRQMQRMYWLLLRGSQGAP